MIPRGIVIAKWLVITLRGTPAVPYAMRFTPTYGVTKRREGESDVKGIDKDSKKSLQFVCGRSQQQKAFQRPCRPEGCPGLEPRPRGFGHLVLGFLPERFEAAWLSKKREQCLSSQY